MSDDDWLARSPLPAWGPEVVASAGRVLVIGVATWSHYDRRLLGLVGDRSVRPEPDCAVCVFDMDRAPGGIDLRVPGQRRPLHSPVVGLWWDGRFSESACGHAGRRLAYRALGMDPAAAEEYVLGGPAE